MSIAAMAGFAQVGKNRKSFAASRYPFALLIPCQLRSDPATRQKRQPLGGWRFVS